jgi:hypothetical protein
MTLNIHTPSALVKFYSLKPGDVFRYEINGMGHYFMKTVKTKNGCNCVDFTDSTLGHMDESDCVYEVQSAELNITN